MKIRLSTLNDVPRIMEIIDDAKALLKSLHIDQWQNGYPNTEQVENDIANGESFVVINADDTIMATTMFTTRPEQTYKKVFDGEWIVNETKPYGVIHRLAIHKDFRGLGIAKFIFEELHQKLKQQNIKSLKIDTHEENLGMQSLIKKMGYQYSGIIYTSYNAKRLAFEKIIE
jgi:GNAT superfamily N-acetyltransferase